MEIIQDSRVLRKIFCLLGQDGHKMGVFCSEWVVEHPDVVDVAVAGE